MARVFFGYYPKTAFMSERERKWSLNKKVREPLKKNIQQRFTNDEGREDPKVHIIIMRACLYTAEKSELQGGPIVQENN